MKAGEVLVGMGVTLMLATTAYAGAWYKAESCVDMSSIGGPSSSCSIEDCSRSDQSPKDIYDVNGGKDPINDSNRITDRSDGGVDVTVQGRNVFTFFRTAKACKEYTAPLLKIEKQREREEEKENEEMNQKYN
jgi:hypothetical protein